MSLGRTRRIVLLTAALLVCVVLAGSTYQGVATALERRRYPHPGRLIDLGGHQLHLACTGTGAPTVVLEAPALGFSAAWGWVQPAVARETRVCSYDRAGLGWSEAGERPFEPEEAARQLAMLLERGGERGPFVVAGLGWGALQARLDAARLGPGTLAVVLFAPADPQSILAGRSARLLPWSPWLARTGVLRAGRILSRVATGMPDDRAGAVATFLNRPDHLTRAAAELRQADDLVAAAAAAAIPSSTRVIEQRITTPDGTLDGLAYLADRDRALAVAREIVQAVRAVRE